MDHGVVLDLETTGLSAKSERIIEIGILEFALDASLKPSIVSMYSGLEDPERPLSEEIQKITGLNAAMLHGRKIDWSHVRRALESSSVVIAHNAPFDSAFIAERPELADLSLHWACSVRHLPWRKMGFRSSSLNYLAADHGFLNPFAHRALFDCATTFRLIAPHVDQLIRRSYEPDVTLVATNAAFETKDLLRNQGYHWDKDQRVWKKTVLRCDLEEEREFLRSQIYRGELRHQEYSGLSANPE